MVTSDAASLCTRTTGTSRARSCRSWVGPPARPTGRHGDLDDRDPHLTDATPGRQGLDRPTWERVLAIPRARVLGSTRQRASTPAAIRDLAVIQTVGGAGLALPRAAQPAGRPVRAGA